MDKGVVKRVIVTPDKHFPLHDQPAINCVLRAIEIVKPNYFIHLGDVIEGESVSHWKYKRRKRPPIEFILPEIDEEIKEGNKGLDRIDKVLKSINGNSIVVQRGKDSTIATSHVNGAGIHKMTGKTEATLPLTGDNAGIEAGDDFGFNETTSFYQDFKSYSSVQGGDV